MTPSFPQNGPGAWPTSPIIMISHCRDGWVGKFKKWGYHRYHYRRILKIFSNDHPPPTRCGYATSKFLYREKSLEAVCDFY